ncbi:uncharacterized protein LOC119193364 [Manduca sexta]|uniref:uncharacterized protein LOC119193364 n=1 Tax=Manduca sexta TaxID=7130 RepID=UPI00188F22BE|nr:uncharacterized protein LOC119193364 [Manduca sexta]
MEKETRENWKCHDCTAEALCGYHAKSQNSQAFETPQMAMVPYTRREMPQRSGFGSDAPKSQSERYRTQPPEEMDLNKSRAFIELKASVKQNTLRANDVNDRMDSLEQKVDLIDRQKLKGLEYTLTQLKNHMRAIDQDLLVNDIEITGIPEARGERINSIVLAVARRLRVSMGDRDIVAAFRLTLPRPQFAGAVITRPRPIAVTLAHPALKMSLLEAARARPDVSIADLGFYGLPNHFHVNHRLSKYNHQLYHKVKEAARIKKWRFVWSKNGKIFSRGGYRFGNSQIILRS